MIGLRRRVAVIAGVISICANMVCADGGKAVADDGGSLFTHDDGSAAKEADYSDFSSSLEACEGGMPKECHRVGVFYQMGVIVERNDFAAMRAYQKACKANFAYSCINLGILQLSSQDQRVNNLEGAVKAFDMACSGGVSQGCYRLGVALRNGVGAEVDLKGAFAAHLKGCKGAFAASCTSIGHAYTRGRGVSESKEIAYDYYSRACDLGSGEGCFAMGFFILKGISVDQSDQGAVELFDRACGMGDANGCLFLSRHFLLEQDYVRQRQLLQRSCNLGLTKACEEFQNLPEN